MSTRNAILLAILTLFLGLLLGTFGGGVTAFFLARRLSGPSFGQAYGRAQRANPRFPNGPFSNRRFPAQPYPNIPYPSAPYGYQPYPYAPYPYQPYPYAPYPYQPNPNTPLPNRRFPNQTLPAQPAQPQPTPQRPTPRPNRPQAVPTQPSQPQPSQPQPTPAPRATAPSSNAITGARIVSIDPGSPAEKAGLQVGDVITAVDTTSLDAQHALADLIQAHKPGDTVNLAVQRNNATQTISVTLGSSPQNNTAAYLGIRYSPAF